MPPLEVDCPTCGTRITWNSTYPFRPFCSERCKLIDLGQWAHEQYRVAGEAVDSDENTPPSL